MLFPWLYHGRYTSSDCLQTLSLIILHGAEGPINIEPMLNHSSPKLNVYPVPTANFLPGSNGCV